MFWFDSILIMRLNSNQIQIPGMQELQIEMV